MCGCEYESLFRLMKSVSKWTSSRALGTTSPPRRAFLNLFFFAVLSSRKGRPRGSKRDSVGSNDFQAPVARTVFENILTSEKITVWSMPVPRRLHRELHFLHTDAHRIDCSCTYEWFSQKPWHAAGQSTVPSADVITSPSIFRKTPRPERGTWRIVRNCSDRKMKMKICRVIIAPHTFPRRYRTRTFCLNKHEICGRFECSWSEKI